MFSQYVPVLLNHPGITKYPFQIQGNRIGTYSINREEVSVGDLACYSISCPTVSLYDTLGTVICRVLPFHSHQTGEDSIGYVLDHAEAVAVFCSRDKLKKVRSNSNYKFLY